MVRKTLLGLVIAVAAIGATPIAASAAVEPVSYNEPAPGGSGRTTTPEPVDPAGGMMPVMGLWAGVGVLGLTAGMITVTTIARRQKISVSRVAAATP